MCHLLCLSSVCLTELFFGITRVTGSECERHVKGYTGARYKKFASYDEAKKFVENEHETETIPSKRLKVANGQSSQANLLLTTSSDEENSVYSDHSPHMITFYHDATCPRRVMVYTDGSCKGALDDRHAGYGVYWGPSHPNVSERLEGEQTNNRAEIEAVICAIKQAHASGITHLGIVTDSKFTQNCATEWGKRWARNSWKLANGEDAKLKEPVKRLLELIAESGIEITWHHVRGHKGVHGNEEADCLANIGADKPLPKK
ncbi:Ribonuclease H1 [Schistosoma japonicum]|nr:Ribonuclease H1 [Schistosoma japonicum]